jgi:hypothetical protein
MLSFFFKKAVLRFWSSIFEFVTFKCGLIISLDEHECDFWFALHRCFCQLFGSLARLCKIIGILQAEVELDVWTIYWCIYCI